MKGTFIAFGIAVSLATLFGACDNRSPVTPNPLPRSQPIYSLTGVVTEPVGVAVEGAAVAVLDGPHKRAPCDVHEVTSGPSPRHLIRCSPNAEDGPGVVEEGLRLIRSGRRADAAEQHDAAGVCGRRPAPTGRAPAGPQSRCASIRRLPAVPRTIVRPRARSIRRDSRGTSRRLLGRLPPATGGRQAVTSAIRRQPVPFAHPTITRPPPT